MSLKLETAVQKDLPRLVELLGILFESEAEFSADAEKQRVALHAILSDPARGKIYVAREGREVVAMCSLLYTISTAEGGKAALFEDLVVAPDHRKRGIGASLLKHVIAEYKHQAQTITCVCGWHGRSSSPDGRTSEWTAHLAAFRTKPR